MRRRLRPWASAWIFSACICAQQFELPQINTANFLPAIQLQINRAEEEARTHPRDAKAAGEFAMALHAYQLYDAAAQTYQKAHSLEPQEIDWIYFLGAVQMQLGQFDDAAQSFRSAL